VAWLELVIYRIVEGEEGNVYLGSRLHIVYGIAATVSGDIMPGSASSENLVHFDRQKAKVRASSFHH
jgi:hypothetical protein